MICCNPIQWRIFNHPWSCVGVRDPFSGQSCCIINRFVWLQSPDHDNLISVRLLGLTTCEFFCTTTNEPIKRDQCHDPFDIDCMVLTLRTRLVYGVRVCWRTEILHQIITCRQVQFSIAIILWLMTITDYCCFEVGGSKNRNLRNPTKCTKSSVY